MLIGNLANIILMHAVQLVFLFQQLRQIFLKAFSCLLQALALRNERVILLHQFLILPFNVFNLSLDITTHLCSFFLPAFLAPLQLLILLFDLFKTASELDNFFFFSFKVLLHFSKLDVYMFDLCIFRINKLLFLYHEVFAVPQLLLQLSNFIVHFGHLPFQLIVLSLWNTHLALHLL